MKLSKVNPRSDWVPGRGGRASECGYFFRVTAYGLNTQCLFLAAMKIPTFDGHLNQSNTDLRRCSMEYKPRRKLTREFKLEAVRQTALSEKPKAQLARELGVRVGQLRTWRLEF